MTNDNKQGELITKQRNINQPTQTEKRMTNDNKQDELITKQRNIHQPTQQSILK